MSTTIVIPCYNYGRFLGEAIQSALDQTVACDIVVVNDGSTDDTTAVASRYPVRLVEQDNAGIAAARNVGVRRSHSEHLVILDADDVLARDYVAKCESAIPGHAIATPWLHTFGDGVNTLMEPVNAPYSMMRQDNWIQTGSMFTKHAWEAVGGYKKIGLEDWDFWLSILAAGYTCAKANTIYHYRKHGISLMTYNEQHKTEHVLALQTKHPPRPDLP